MNFRNKVFGILMASSAIFISCKDENKAAEPATTSQTETTTSESSSTTAALNPSHGEPGHRCDIPVGAPLDQASSVNTAQQQKAATSSSVSPVRVNGASATPTKNPPHGQPGHDCAVPVGADLN